MKKKKRWEIYQISGIAYPSIYMCLLYIYIYISTEYCIFILHERRLDLICRKKKIFKLK